jgi:hypothetical protein
MMRAVLVLVVATGCYSDFRIGGSAPVGHGHGGAGFDLGVGLGGEHRGERIRAGGGFNFGYHGADSGESFVPLGLEGRIDIGLTEPNEHGGRFMAVGHGALGVGFAEEEMGSGGFFAQTFIGLGYGATKAPDPGKIVADHVAVGMLAMRFSPENGDGYWLLGAALSLSYGLDIDELLDVK